MKGRVIVGLPFGFLVLTVLFWRWYLLPEKRTVPGKIDKPIAGPTFVSVGNSTVSQRNSRLSFSESSRSVAIVPPKTVLIAERSTINQRETIENGAVSTLAAERPNAPSATPAAASGKIRLDAVLGEGRVRIEGTSGIHDWQIESTIIGGYLEVGPNFPLEPAGYVTPGRVDAQAEAFIPVRSLKSVEKDGSPFSDQMNEIMYDRLKQTNATKIIYRLTELLLKEMPKSTNSPYSFDSKGELVVAGVTNEISMLVEVTPVGGKKVQIAGNTNMKMSDFNIEPPRLIGDLGAGDKVKLFFKWAVMER